MPRSRHHVTLLPLAHFFQVPPIAENLKKRGWGAIFQRSRLFSFLFPKRFDFQPSVASEHWTGSDVVFLLQTLFWLPTNVACILSLATFFNHTEIFSCAAAVCRLLFPSHSSFKKTKCSSFKCSLTDSCQLSVVVAIPRRPRRWPLPCVGASHLYDASCSPPILKETPKSWNTGDRSSVRWISSSKRTAASGILISRTKCRWVDVTSGSRRRFHSMDAHLTPCRRWLESNARSIIKTRQWLHHSSNKWSTIPSTTIIAPLTRLKSQVNIWVLEIVNFPFVCVVSPKG